MTPTQRSGRRDRTSARAAGERASASQAVVFALFLVLGTLTAGALAVDGPVSGSGGPVDGGAVPTAADAASDRTEASAVEARTESADVRRPRGLVGPDANATVDADGDGVSDAAEREVYGTDPNESDTDGDGYPDGMEIACDDRLPGADPLHHDLFLEVDTVEGATLDAAAVDHLVGAFADAPVDNPDGESGIDLHVERSDAALPANGSVDSESRSGDHDDLRDYRRRYADHGDDGYYYVLVAPNAAFRGDDYYAGAGIRGAVVVESFDSPAVTSSLIMHELGHAFGLGPEQTGVDEERFDREAYRSVMNYNGIYELTTYSDGTDDVGRDEWAFVAEDRHRPPIDCGENGTCAAACAAGSYTGSS